jgi:hypothetical protein
MKYLQRVLPLLGAPGHQFFDSNIDLMFLMDRVVSHQTLILATDI